MAYTRRRRVYRRRPGRRVYRKKGGALRRTMRGSQFYHNPLGLLKLRRHFSGSSGGRKPFRFPKYNIDIHGDQPDLDPHNPYDDPELYDPNHNWDIKTPKSPNLPLPVYDVNNSFIRKVGRFGLDSVGRNIRALAYGLPLPIPGKEIIGDLINDGAHQLGEYVSPQRFMGNNKAQNALLSFVDGEDRPGSLNTYTDAIGKGFASIANPESVLKLRNYYNNTKLLGDFAKTNLSYYLKGDSPIKPKTLDILSRPKDVLRGKGKVRPSVPSLLLGPSEGTLLESPAESTLRKYMAKKDQLASIKWPEPPKIDYRRPDTQFSPLKNQSRRDRIQARHDRLDSRAVVSISPEDFLAQWDDLPSSPYKPPRTLDDRILAIGDGVPLKTSDQSIEDYLGL